MVLRVRIKKKERESNMKMVHGRKASERIEKQHVVRTLRIHRHVDEIDGVTVVPDLIMALLEVWNDEMVVMANGRN